MLSALRSITQAGAYYPVIDFSLAGLHDCSGMLVVYITINQTSKLLFYRYFGIKVAQANKNVPSSRQFALVLK